MELEEIKNIIAKEFGINSIGSPLGSCTEKFLNNKILEVASKHNFPADIVEIFKQNPYKFRGHQKFDNGLFSGRYFVSLLCGWNNRFMWRDKIIMDSRHLPLKITPGLIKVVNEVEKRRMKIDQTTTIELVKKENGIIGDKIIEIVKKYGKDLSLKKLDDGERSVVKKYLEILSKMIKQDMHMCKIFPQSEIKEILSLKRGLIGFFSRKADIDFLLKGKNDYFKILYEGLRLDYNGSKFKLSDNYMGMLIVSMPNFSLRTPITKELSDSESLMRKIYIENDSPYSGIGFISNEWCVPEFYISISDKSNIGMKNYGSFPQEAFSASFKIISHNSSLIELASYDAGDFECAADEKFVIYEKYNDFAKNNGWI